MKSFQKTYSTILMGKVNIFSRNDWLSGKSEAGVGFDTSLSIEDSSHLKLTGQDLKSKS